MQSGGTDQANWIDALRRYLGASIAGNLIWEVLQLPLYTLWSTGTPQQQAFAVLHCTAGDTMIAALTLLAALIAGAPAAWPRAGMMRVFVTTLVLGVGYTIYSEWLNTTVRHNWAYADLMPVLPLLGVGLAPLLQWLVIPTLAHGWAIRRWPWRTPVN